MEIFEYGDKDKKKIILIHGFQSPYQVWNDYIEHYKNDFHIIVPVLTGHSQTKKEDFISISETVKELENYYISKYGKDVYAVYGMSMGGVLTAQIWQNQRLNIEKIIFDGSPLISVNLFIKKFMVTFYLNVTHKTQKRDDKTIKQAVKSIIPERHLNPFLKVFDNMTDTTIINCLNDVCKFKLNTDIETRNTKVYYFHGTDTSEYLAMKSAKYLKKNYPSTVIKCFKGKAHCENSLFHTEIMIKELEEII